MEFTLRGVPMPLWVRTAVPMTDEELIRLSAANDILRIEREPDGELSIRPIQGSVAGAINVEVMMQLHDWIDTGGGGEIVGADAGFALPDGSVRAASLAWVRSARFEGVPREQREGFLPLCPDFVVEIRGFSDSREYIEWKMRQWMENGTEVGWLIDPEEKTGGGRGGCVARG